MGRVLTYNARIKLLRESPATRRGFSVFTPEGRCIDPALRVPGWRPANHKVQP
jgi:hypothetical protein